MKKLISAFLAACFVLTAFAGFTFAKTENEAAQTVKKYIDVEVGTEKTAVFTFESVKNHSDKIELRDENGKTVSVMTDKGTKGDKSAHDGTYSAKVKLSSDETGVVTYAAYCGGEKVKEYEVNFYREYSQADYDRLDAINADINSYEAELENKGLSDSMIYDSMTAYIERMDGIESVKAENGSVTYVTDGGIPCVYARLSGDTKGAANGNGSELTAYTADGESVELSGTRGNESLQSWTNPNILLVRPFRNVAGEDGFHNENYVNAAKNITKYSNGYITILDDENTCPAKLRDNFWKNGFIMVDSHGLTSGDCSYMVVWDGDGYGAADINAGRVLKTNTPNHVLVTGSYFQYNYDNDNIRMENTFLYFGICFGMLYEKLRQPFFEMGAVCAYGYDNSVTMGYEAMNLKTMYPYMAKLCASDETRTYNLEEAAAEAIRVNGAIDPYSDLGTKLITDGDTHFVFYKPDVALEGMEFSMNTIDDAIQNTNCYIPVKLSPENMVYGYTQEWTSSDPDVIEILGPRVGYCKSVGTAKISAKFTYDGRTFEDSCTVTISEIRPETIDVRISAVNARFKVGQTRDLYATVNPTNASAQDVTFTSNNPGVVTVDAKGVLTSYRPGRAVIRVASKKYPAVYTDFYAEIVTDEVYAGGAQLNTEFTYLIVSKESSPNMLTAVESSTEGYVQHRSASKYLGHYSGNINDVCFWKFIPASSSSYYLYNSANKVYLSRGENGTAVLTNEPETKLAFDGTYFNVVNVGEDDVNVCLKVLAKKGGFCFGEKSGQSSKFDLARVMDYTNKAHFSTVKFDANGSTTATQVVEKGGKAVAATAPAEIGMTFLGWDICLADITGDVTANAVYENGESDKIILTFKDFDGTLIKRVEFMAGESFTAPEAPVHEGLTFAGWSEDITKPTQNMIVFAMYESDGLTGDVNGDGKVNTGDATQILKYAAGMLILSDTQLANGDTNHDGKVNTGDATLVLKYSAGMITQF